MSMLTARERLATGLHAETCDLATEAGVCLPCLATADLLLASGAVAEFPSWARAVERHPDGRVCLLNPASGLWFVDTEPPHRPRVRPVCDRAHLADPAALAGDDDRVRIAAAAIYGDGDPEEWLRTVDGSPNAASCHYARTALGSLAPRHP